MRTTHLFSAMMTAFAKVAPRTANVTPFLHRGSVLKRIDRRYVLSWHSTMPNTVKKTFQPTCGGAGQQDMKWDAKIAYLHCKDLRREGKRRH
jgi:hypothetical protein